jgi:zinc transport system substrate-binding protein
VVVSIPPLAALVEAVAPDAAEVEVVLPAGASPESWAATPGALVAVAEADLLVVVGHPEAVFESRLESQAEEAGVRVVRVAGGSSAEVEGDPHLWLDLDLMRAAARSVAEVLAESRPLQAANLTTRVDTFGGQIDVLDELLRGAFAQRRLDQVVVQHPAWSRLLGRYGIEEVVVEVDGKQATPARLIELIELVGELEPPALIAQQGLSRRDVELIARETGVAIETLDPLSPDWLGGLKTAAETLARAVQ